MEVFKPTCTSRVVLYDTDRTTGEKPILDASGQKSLVADAVNAPIFVRNSDRQTFTINHMVFRSKHRSHFARILYRDIPDDGTKVQRSLTINFDRGICHVYTADGPRDVSSLMLQFAVYLERSETSLPKDAMFVYSDGNQPILYGAEYEIEVLGQPVRVSFYQKPDSNEIRITIAPPVLRDTPKQ